MYYLFVVEQGLDLEDPGLQGGGAVIPEGSQPVRQQTYYIFHPVTQAFLFWPLRPPPQKKNVKGEIGNFLSFLSRGVA